MYTNAPTPELYRIAELRRNEEIGRVVKRRRHKLLTPSQPGWFDLLRNRLGQSLINVGERLVGSYEQPVRSHSTRTI